MYHHYYHSLCGNIVDRPIPNRTNPFVQQTLVKSSSGNLSICPPQPYPPRRTPLPNNVRRIANTVIPTCPPSPPFLLFPAEIRLQIYRLLLIYAGPDICIAYPICPEKRTIVNHAPNASHPLAWGHRHRLFPSILECCRTINEEGSAVLYGENYFQIEGAENTPIYRSWNPGPLNLSLITKLSLRYVDSDYYCGDETYVLAWLPNVREMRLHVEDQTSKGWEEFLVRSESFLCRMKKIRMVIRLGSNSVKDDATWEALISNGVLWKKLYALERGETEDRGRWRRLKKRV